ncbi:MAG TPA: PAS domain S-box protein, partial [Candidatus Angelobacter sp.]|nr:PAS domain S-box protein [Candidatus Angelobacter sp.]
MGPLHKKPEIPKKGSKTSAAVGPSPLDYESIFHLLVDSVTDYAIFLLSTEGVVVSWSPGAERIKGYKAAEIIGKNFTVFYPEADLQAGKPAMELRVAGEVGRFEDEGWRIRKDGSRFWASVIITALRDETGTLIGFGKITRDLTDRREAELRHRLLIEGVTDYAIYSLDVNGTITSWNAGAQRIKGYSAEEIIGKNFSNFYTREDAEGGLPAKVLVEAARHGHFEGEGWRVRKDGTRFWSNVVVTPMRDESGDLIGFTKITRDMTDRMQLLERIQQHAHELEHRIAETERANAELEAFGYSVSHDLRAPLRAIEGFSDIILTDFGEQLPGRVAELLQNVLKAVARMNHLVQDLLSYSRLGRIDIDAAAVNVLRVAREAQEQIPENLRDKVTISIDPALTVAAHHATLIQVLVNLIDNGLKFHSQGQSPRVDVTAHRDKQNVIITVCDEGIGIAEQHQQRIFQVFERLHATE